MEVLVVFGDFEERKTKPIFGKAKVKRQKEKKVNSEFLWRAIWKNKANFWKVRMALSQHWQWIMAIIAIGQLVKTNPILSFSVRQTTSLAQTTVLIGVNPCLTECDLKKQACPERSRMEPIYLVLRAACCVLRKGIWKNKANVKMGKIPLSQ